MNNAIVFGHQDRTASRHYPLKRRKETALFNWGPEDQNRWRGFLLPLGDPLLGRERSQACVPSRVPWPSEKQCRISNTVRRICAPQDALKGLWWGRGRGWNKETGNSLPYSSQPSKSPPPHCQLPPAISCASGRNLILNINKPEAHHPGEAQTL